MRFVMAFKVNFTSEECMQPLVTRDQQADGPEGSGPQPHGDEA